MSQALAVGSSTRAVADAMPRFACSWEVGGWNAAWVRAAGELDLASSPQFCRVLEEAQRAVPLVVLDLRELCFIDSSGVHIILDAARRARRYEGQLLIARGPAQVDRVLALTNVCKQVVTFDLAPTGPAQAQLPALPPRLVA
jgi:anti-sigma B factor antagonist